MFTNPPDSNMPTIDHGLDEDYIWGFQRSIYNQDIIKNPYSKNFLEAIKNPNQPFWGSKLMTPSFYKE